MTYKRAAVSHVPGLAMLLLIALPSAADAQSEGRLYAGGLVGISTLSADARSLADASGAQASLYKPENGPALNLFVGRHVSRFFTVQANYVWNRNDVTLFSSSSSAQGGGFYEQHRAGTQHAVVGDVLLYFRALGDGVRPYLSTGIGVVRFDSGRPFEAIVSGLRPPEGEIVSTRAALRVAVGIDLATVYGWSVRYSFSETIAGNPVSPRLMPPGRRNLANFQNLFGAVRRFR
jgi:hypothetical protein